MNVSGKVVVVTGAARGIGRGIADILRANGAVVVGVDLRAGEGVDITADISGQESNQSVVSYAVHTHGRLDGFIACAAVSRRGPFIEIEPDDLNYTLGTTMFGVFYGCQAAARQMVAQGDGGSLLIINSVHLKQNFPNAASYNMAKGAVGSLARTIAAELAPNRIRVNSILPGWIDTPGELDFASREQLDAAGAAIPLGRMGLPNDIGQAALYLMSDEASYVTGSEVMVDGGITLPARSANPKGSV